MAAWDFEIGAASDPGRKRSQQPNQDALAVLPTALEKGHPPLLIMADGMGGYVGGAAASRLVVDTISACYSQMDAIPDRIACLLECIQKAHETLRMHARGHPELASMGSTVVLALLDEGLVNTANVGDSRAYLFHGSEISLLSYDHSVVADQVRAGLLTPLQARLSPKRNRLTQSLSARRPSVRPHPAQSPITAEDVILLCTDGLWGVISDVVLQAVALELPPQQAADKLVSLANASQAPDNISVIVARRRAAQYRAGASNLEDTNPGL